MEQSIEENEWPSKGEVIPEIRAKIDRKMELAHIFQEEINKQIRSFEEENGVLISLDLEGRIGLLVNIVAMNHDKL